MSWFKFKIHLIKILFLGINEDSLNEKTFIDVPIVGNVSKDPQLKYIKGNRAFPSLVFTDDLTF